MDLVILVFFPVMSEVIGEGTFGIVYGSWTKQFGQIAYKIQKERNVLAFLQEIDLMTKLDHPHLMSMVDVWTKPHLTIVMRYGGVSLEFVLNGVASTGLGGPLWHWKHHACQLLSAVSYLHENQIIHGDLKFSNMVVDTSRVLRLVDLGNAFVDIQGCRYVHTRSGASESGFVYGAVCYRPLELLLGDPNFGKPIDVWAAGCLIAQMITFSALFGSRTVRVVASIILDRCSPLAVEEWEYVKSLPMFREDLLPGNYSGGRQALLQSVQEFVTAEEARWACQAFCVLPWRRLAASAYLRAVPA